jgi:hypothetical protein
LLLFSPWWPTAKISHADSGTFNGNPDPLPSIPLWTMLVWCEIWGYVITVVEYLSLLECDAVSYGWVALMCQRIGVP